MSDGEVRFSHDEPLSTWSRGKHARGPTWYWRPNIDVGRELRRAVFLDRDGVINRRVIGDYVRHWQNFSFLPGVLRAVRALSAIPVPIIVVSNQAGVAKGLMSERDLRELTFAFTDAFASYGGRIDSVYYCLHHPDKRCDCRKPRSGLLRQAAREWGLNLTECFMIGDSESDIIAGASVGCCISAENLSEACDLLLSSMSSAKPPTMLQVTL